MCTVLLRVVFSMAAPRGSSFPPHSTTNPVCHCELFSAYQLLLSAYQLLKIFLEKPSLPLIFGLFSSSFSVLILQNFFNVFLEFAQKSAFKGSYKKTYFFPDLIRIFGRITPQSSSEHQLNCRLRKLLVLAMAKPLFLLNVIYRKE